MSHDELFSTDLVRSYVEAPGFVDRPRLVQRVTHALEHPGCRFVLVTGSPGSGKTALLASLASRCPDALRYFIRRDSQVLLNSGDAQSLLFALGHQLASNRPALFRPTSLEIIVRQVTEKVSAGGSVVGIRIDDLYASPFYRTALSVEQQAKEVHGELVGLSIGRLVSEGRLGEIAALQRLALLDPARVLAVEDPDARIIILIDALDELRYSHAGETALDWLSALPELPANVRFVLASRADDALLERLRRRQAAYLIEERIDADVDAAKGDIERYVRKRLPESVAHEVDVPGLITACVTKSAGNFQYATAILRALEDASARGIQKQVLPLLDIERLPSQLTELYSFFLALVRDDVGAERVPVAGGYASAWHVLYLPVLSVLAVAREPIGIDQLAQLLGGGTEPSWIGAVLDRLAQFLHRTGGRFRFYHSSLAEYLTDPATRRTSPTTYVDGRVWHDKIASRYIESWGGVDTGLTALADSATNSEDRRYGLHHVIPHLVEAGQADLVHQILALDRSRVGGGHEHVWFAAQSHEGELQAFVDDVERAWRLARADSPRAEPSALARACGAQVRYALLKSSVRTQAHHVLPGLTCALVANGIWTLEQAIAHARRLPRAARRTECLVRLATMTHNPARASLLREAVAEARVQEGEAWFAVEQNPPPTLFEAVRSFGSPLPEQVLAEALEIALEEREPERVDALIAIAPLLTPALAERALKAVLQMEAGWQLRPVAALAPRLPADRRSSVVAHALSLWETLPNQGADAAAEMAGLLAHVDPDARRGMAFDLLERARWQPGRMDLNVFGHVPEVVRHLDPHYRPIVVEQWRTEALNAWEAALKLAEDSPDSLADWAPEACRTRVLTPWQVAIDAEHEGSLPEFDERAHRAPARLLERAVKLALAAAENRRVEAVVELATNLPPPTALSVVQGLRHIPEADVKALGMAALLPRIDEKHRQVVAEELLALVPEMSADDFSIRFRDDVLAGVAPYLDQDQLERALGLTESLGDGEQRGFTLAAIAANLRPSAKGPAVREAINASRDAHGFLPSGLLASFGELDGAAAALALEAARGTSNDEASAVNLIGLVPSLREPVRSTVVAELANTVVNADPTRIADAFTTSPADFPLEAYEIFLDALARMNQSGYSGYACHAIEAVADHIPDALVSSVASAALAIAPGLYRWSALAALSHRSPADAYEVLCADCAQRNSGAFLNALHNLAPGLDHHAQRETLDIILGPPHWNQADGLAALAPWLSDDLLDRAWHAAQRLEDTHALAALAGRMSRTDVEDALMTALREARARGVSAEAAAVANIAPLIPEQRRRAIVSSAVERVRRAGPSHDLVAAVEQLAPYLGSEELDSLAVHAITQGIAAGMRQDQTRLAIEAAKLVPLVGKPVLEILLEEIVACVEITRGYHTRTRLLGVVSERLMTLAPADRADVLASLLTWLTTTAARRSHLLGDLAALARPLAAWGGEQACDEMVHAISDAARWFP